MDYCPNHVELKRRILELVAELHQVRLEVRRYVVQLVLQKLVYELFANRLQHLSQFADLVPLVVHRIQVVVLIEPVLSLLKIRSEVLRRFSGGRLD